MDGPIFFPSTKSVATGIELNWTLAIFTFAGASLSFFGAGFSTTGSSGGFSTGLAFAAGAAAGAGGLGTFAASLPTCGAGKTIGAVTALAGASGGAAAGASVL